MSRASTPRLVPAKGTTKLLSELVAMFTFPGPAVAGHFSSKVKDDYILPQDIVVSKHEVHKIIFIDLWENLLLVLAQQDTWLWTFILVQNLEGHCPLEPGFDRHPSICGMQFSFSKPNRFWDILQTTECGSAFWITTLIPFRAFSLVLKCSAPDLPQNHVHCFKERMFDSHFPIFNQQEDQWWNSSKELLHFFLSIIDCPRVNLQKFQSSSQNYCESRSW